MGQAAEGSPTDDVTPGAALVRRLKGLPEAAMRVNAIVDEIEDHDPPAAAWILETIVRGALQKLPDYVAAYDSLLDPEPVASRISPDKLNAMIEAGTEQGCVGATQWLRAASMTECQTPDNPLRLVAFGLQEMPLGERRALARRATGDTMTQLAIDPDPGVIANLLNNPRITEQRVLAICARRPTVSRALTAVLQSPRWISRYRVKLALVRNPYFELRYPLTLLVYLKSPDLADICSDGSLLPMLRLSAQRLIDLVSIDLVSDTDT